MSLTQYFNAALAELASAVNQNCQDQRTNLEAAVQPVELRSENLDEPAGPASILINNDTGKMTVLRYECEYIIECPKVLVTKVSHTSDLHEEQTEAFPLEDTEELAERIVECLDI